MKLFINTLMVAAAISLFAVVIIPIALYEQEPIPKPSAEYEYNAEPWDCDEVELKV